ncbi:MAG: S8 family serine peptidase [Clostridium sp.]|uniref:S8 family serine peptidase n=1 Tax=Clostridium sp. TaxID=1506 RepID=UPI003F33BC85
MFNFKSKLDCNLQLSLKKDIYKKYRVLVKCKSLFSSVLKKITSFEDALIYPIEPCNLISCNLTKKQIHSIAEYPEVEQIFFDEYLFLCGMSISNANNYHKSTSTLKYFGKNICVGIVDSGIYPHIDLTRPSNKIVLFKDLIHNLNHPYDDNGHGTAMAGIICGNGSSSNGMCTGIAPLSKVVAYKAFDALGKGFASDILFAIKDLANISSEHNIKVLCLPFEMLSNNHNISNAFESMLNYVSKKKIIPVLPAGSILNTETGMMDLALIKNALTIGGLSTTASSKPYPYSSKTLFSKTKKPDFTCSCDSIITLNSDTAYISEKNGLKIYPKNIDAKYKTLSGTSISTAFVSAICAILFEYDKSLNIDDIRSIITLSCSNTKEHDVNIVGNGIINLGKLLK